MLDKILDIIKTFVEKYFIQALIAVIPTVIIYYFTPDNFAFLKKIGTELYLLFVFISCFLIIELIFYLFKTIKNNIYYNKLKKEQEEEIETKNLRYLWNFVDSLYDPEKKLLKYFIDNNNKIINIQGGIFFNHRLFMEWCESTQIISDGTIKNFDIYTLKEGNLIPKNNIISQYKLRDDIYEALIYSKKKYGKISNFQ